MILESLLAYAHFLAILTMVVFVSSATALCRAEWMNAQVVQRLGTVNRIYGWAALGVLLTGLARSIWGMKGAGWYWTDGLLHLKLAMFVIVGAMSMKSTAMLQRWRQAPAGTLPGESDVRTARKWLFWQAHLIALIPLPAVFLARGFGH